MELVDGVNLGAWRRAAPRTWRDIVSVYMQAGRGLAAAHGMGLVHHYFKPANALVDSDGVVRVTDFGLVCVAADVREGPSNDGVDATDVALTRTGTLLGTPAYMAPEQHACEPVDVRTDQWSLACSLCEALFETRPFDGHSRRAAIASISGRRKRGCDKLRPLSQRRNNRRRRLRVPRTTSIAEPALFGHLAACESILVAGAGGGFDIYAGLPLAYALWRRGQTVHLANLSFTNLVLSDAERLAPSLYKVAPDTAGPDEYFPERALARFLEGEKLPSTVYAFPRLGVRQLLVAYQALVKRLDLDAIVLVDGGTDILMFGDESAWARPWRT